MRLLVFFLYFIPMLGFAQIISDGGAGRGRQIIEKNVDSSRLNDSLNATFQPQNGSRLYQLIPQDVPESKRHEFSEIIKKLNEICPACATGVTLSGPVVVGPNFNRGNPPLFKGVSGLGYISIKISEYNTLKEKAEKYDQLKK